MEIEYKEIITNITKAAYSIFSGEHNTVFSGSGIELDRVEEADEFSDAKDINWRATAKRGSLMINRFVDDRSLEIVIVYLADGGMSIGNKHQLALKLIVSTVYIALNQQANITLIVPNSSDSIDIYRSKSIYDFAKVSYEVLKDIDIYSLYRAYETTIYNVSKVISKKSIIFVVGDFLDLVPLEYLLPKHQVIAMVVREELDENPSIVGNKTIYDPSLGIKKRYNITKSTIKKYKDALLLQDSILEKSILINSGSIKKFYTNKDPYESLSILLRYG